MITVRIPLAQQYAYIEATFDSTVEVNEAELYDLVARLDDAAPKEDVRQPYTPRDDADRAPQERRQAPPRPATGRAPGRGTNLFCPDHGVEVMASAPQYNRDGDKYYHPLEQKDWYRLPDGRTSKSHTLYERQLVGPDQVGF